MKFAIAVVMLALAVGAQASYAGHYAPAVSYVSHAAHPAGYWGGAYGGWGWGAPAAVAVHSSGWGHSGPGPYDGGYYNGGYYGGYGKYAGIAGISLAQGPGHAGLAAPLALGHGHGHEGVYVAKTRGAVHTAPLAGHINSATSINVAPAPGTH